MLITPEDQAKQPSDRKVQKDELPATPDEVCRHASRSSTYLLNMSLLQPPPSYSPQTESVASTSSLPTFKTKPTNLLSLSTRDSTIRGEFVIDPSICIPSVVLPPLNDGETENDRKNLSLTSKHSSVYADIWLLGSSAPIVSDSATGISKHRRTTIALTSDHGSIHAQLVCPFRPLFHVSAALTAC